MPEVYNIHQALRIMMEYHLTDSVQVLSRWLREGKIHGERSANRKEGWLIRKEDLYDYIDKERDGLVAQNLFYKDILKSIPFEDVSSLRLEEDMPLETTEIEVSTQENLDGKMAQLKKEYDQKLIEIQAQFENQYNKLEQQIGSQKSDIGELRDDINARFDQLLNKMGVLHQTDGTEIQIKNKETTPSIETTSKTYDEFISLLEEAKGIPNGFVENREDLIKNYYRYYFDGRNQIKPDFIRDDGKGYCSPHRRSVVRKKVDTFIKEDMVRELSKEIKTFENQEIDEATRQDSIGDGLNESEEKNEVIQTTLEFDEDE